MRILIFVVAYNAEKTIEKVINRIPKKVFTNYDYEILIIDDSSNDDTFSVGKQYKEKNKNLNIKVLYNPVNQGYGGNQKLGYHYAIINNFDAVLLLHGDGQYPPEQIEPMIEPILSGKAQAVFGSRMLKRFGALKGGMPLYKYIGNKILTSFQNRMLKLKLSEFHSGFRAYSVKALSEIPFERNSNDFHFDTQIIIQLALNKNKIHEIPIPTYYGNEICYVNGIKYAYDVFKTTILSRMHGMSILYQREYDIEKDNSFYTMKQGYDSSHTKAIEAVESNSSVFDFGCGQGLILKELKKKDCKTSGMDQYDLVDPKGIDKYIKANINDMDSYKDKLDLSKKDNILMLDVIEHLTQPEKFLDLVREKSKLNPAKVILTTGNVAFFIVRMQLLLSNFNYGKQGILDLTHTRLFTFQSIAKLLKSCGYIVTKTEGIPAPFPKAIGDNILSRFMVFVNKVLIKFSKKMFSYQIYIEAKPTPVVSELLDNTIK